MIRKLLLTLAFLGAIGSAQAQNVQCSNRSAGDSTNACANTRFVTSAIASVPMIIGTTPITGGVSGRVLFDNAGILGEYIITGSGNVVMSASPTFTGTLTVAAGNFSGAVAFSSAITYGGVALANAVTGTGNMVLSAGPTFTGTVGFGSFSSVWDSTNNRFVIRKDNSSAFPVPSDTAGVTVFGPDPGESRFNALAMDSDGVFFCGRVNNTWAAPQPILDGQQICNLTGGSIINNGDTVFQQGGYIGSFAKGNYAPGSTGWYWDFGVIANGSTTLVKSFRLSDTAGASVGPNSVFPASGIMNADTGYTVNNAATSGNVLRADGTKFTSALLGATDVTNIGLTNYKVTGINFNNANTDTSITLTAPNGYSRYQIFRHYISHCSASATTSTFSLFTAAAGGGTALEANPTANVINTASENTATNVQSVSITTGSSGGTLTLNVTPLFFRVITPQGSAVTCDVTLQIQWIS